MKIIKAINGFWNQIKGQMQQRYAMLRNNNKYLLEGRNTEAYGKSQMEESKDIRHVFDDDFFLPKANSEKKLTSGMQNHKVQMNWMMMLVAVVLLSATACSSPKKKVENAQEEVKESEENLEQANKEYLEDMENYKVETKKKIKENEKAMADFKERIKNEKADVKADYEIKIAALEKKNSDFTLRMDNYKADGRESWDKFKAELSYDMDELGKAFKDLTVKNVK
jgi:hypothetical protein